MKQWYSINKTTGVEKPVSPDEMNRLKTAKFSAKKFRFEERDIPDPAPLAEKPIAVKAVPKPEVTDKEPAK